MKRTYWQILLLTVWTLAGTDNTVAGDLQVTASVDRTVMAVNQEFTYSVELSGEEANAVSGNPQLPEMAEFASYLGSSGTSQSIQIINGRMSVSKTFSYSFLATKVGKFQIGPAEIFHKGQVYRTQPIEIEITATATPRQVPSQRQPGSGLEAQDTVEGNLFLKASVNKRTVYQNEPVIITYRIYTRVNITSYGIYKLPNTAGFWAEDFELPAQPTTHEEIIGGRKFLVAEIKKTALFPTNPGRKTIDPMIIDCDVRVQQRRRTRDFFDSFFDDPFFGRTVRQRVSSDPISIDVLPLPEQGKPANFSGAVGSFTLTANVDKNSIKTNEALTLKIEISGKGNIKILSTPSVEIPSDFEKYEPKVTEKINKKGEVVSGSKTFEYVLIARFPGLQKIKPIEFSYFDINSGSYRTLKTPEIMVNVEKGAGEFLAVGPGLSKEEVRLIGQDIRFIQKSIPEFRKIGSYYYKSASFLTLLLLPIFLVIASWGYRRHLDKLSGDIAYARSSKANQMARRRLRKALKALNEPSQKEFYAETSRALIGFVADKFNVPEAGIVTDQVEELLKQKKVDDGVLSRYLECLKFCDYQRFAPSTSKKDEMCKFYNQAKEVIIDLEKIL